MAKRDDTQQPEVSEASSKEAISSSKESLRQEEPAPTSVREEGAKQEISAEEEVRSYIEFQPSIMLSRFGIRTAEDARRFLESPEGEVEMGEAAKEISHHKAEEEERIFEEHEATMLAARIRAFIIHWLLEKEAHAEHHLMDQTRELNDKLLAHGKQNLAKEDEYQHRERERTLEHYDRALTDVQNQLTKNAAQSVDLEKELEQLKAHEAAIHAKYKVLDQLFHDLDNLMPAEGMWSPEEIGKQIGLLHQDMRVQSEAINELFEGDNNPEEVMALRHNLHGLHLKLAHLQEMQAVHHGDKYFVNAEGEKVDSFRQANFILAKDQKIVKHDNQLYLLQSGQDWNAVKESPSALKAAQAAFEHAKPQLMPVRNAIQHHRKLELADHQDKVQANQQKMAANQQEKQLLNNQVRQIQAARADVANALRRPNADVEAAPRPTPTAGSGHAHKPNVSPTMQFRQQVKALKAQQEPVTPERLFNLAAQIPNNKQLMTLLNQRLANFPPKGPISPNLLPYLLKSMERFGIDATKPNVTSLQNPREKAAQAQQEQEERAPSPFNMSPDPFKK